MKSNFELHHKLNKAISCKCDEPTITSISEHVEYRGRITQKLLTVSPESKEFTELLKLYDFVEENLKRILNL